MFSAYKFNIYVQYVQNPCSIHTLSIHVQLICQICSGYTFKVCINTVVAMLSACILPALPYSFAFARLRSHSNPQIMHQHLIIRVYIHWVCWAYTFNINTEDVHLFHWTYYLYIHVTRRSEDVLSYRIFITQVPKWYLLSLLQHQSWNTWFISLRIICILGKYEGYSY